MLYNSTLMTPPTAKFYALYNLYYSKFFKRTLFMTAIKKFYMSIHLQEQPFYKKNSKKGLDKLITTPINST